MRRGRIDLYATAVYLPETGAQWRRLAKKLPFLEPDPPDSVGYASFAAGRVAGSDAAAHLVFWVEPGHDSGAALADTCAHEASHGAEAIMGWIGHDTGGEPLAYLVGWLAGWLWDAVTAKQP